MLTDLKQSALVFQESYGSRLSGNISGEILQIAGTIIFQKYNFITSNEIKLLNCLLMRVLSEII